jgi:2-C-methyl-D-erythritol 2,4-cyclodiphosphate synthase
MPPLPPSTENSKKPQWIPLVGTGYDVHQFAEGRPLILGGVEIPHSRGLAGHSDADVLCHAIADAILGALGLPDIGHYFPPDDPDCEGISSLKIIAKAITLADELGAELCNVDATLIAEAPKVLPHAEAMKDKLSQALRLPDNRIGIKATTNERMGFVGREEGIAAIATASLLKQR